MYITDKKNQGNNYFNKKSVKCELSNSVEKEFQDKLIVKLFFSQEILKWLFHFQQLYF